MKVVILAGGYGTRLSEFTEVIPKPMVPIGGKPIIWHIMKTYAHHGHKDFLIALGYKSEIIKQYFLNYYLLNSDFTVNLDSGDYLLRQRSSIDWSVTLVSTGEKSMTGGRVKRLQNYIGNKPFMLTYGDGVADIDLTALLKFHRSHGKMVTITAVRPSARFGELDIEDNCVKHFQEKPQLREGWINGGFFIIEPEFLELISDDSIMLEREPLVQASQLGQVMAYKHHGFWQCVDTKRDHELLESLWSQDPPWVPR